MMRAAFASALTIASGLALAMALAACTQGTTPDCASVKCGPDLDGTLPVEAAAEGGDAAVEAGEASSDAMTDAASDG